MVKQWEPENGRTDCEQNDLTLDELWLMAMESVDQSSFERLFIPLRRLPEQIQKDSIRKMIKGLNIEHMHPRQRIQFDREDPLEGTAEFRSDALEKADRQMKLISLQTIQQGAVLMDVSEEEYRKRLRFELAARFAKTKR